MQINKQLVARMRNGAITAVLAIGVTCACLGVFLAFSGTALRQSRAESLSSTAVQKSVRADKKTSAISREQRIIRERTIANCDALRDYVQSAINSRRQSESTLKAIADVDTALAAAYAKRPELSDISRLYRARVPLDLARLHIAHQSELELVPPLQQSCTLPMPVGT